MVNNLPDVIGNVPGGFMLYSDDTGTGAQYSTVHLVTEAARPGILVEPGNMVFTTDEKKYYFGDGTTFGGKRIPYATDINSELNNKVDKEANKGLSTEDFTTALKDKLENIPNDPIVVNHVFSSVM